MHALAEFLKERGFGNTRIGIEKHFLATGYVEGLVVLIP